MLKTKADAAFVSFESLLQTFLFRDACDGGSHDYDFRLFSYSERCLPLHRIRTLYTAFIPFEAGKKNLFFSINRTKTFSMKSLPNPPTLSSST
jgi:hypothetical protein